MGLVVLAHLCLYLLLKESRDTVISSVLALIIYTRMAAVICVSLLLPPLQLDLQNTVISHVQARITFCMRMEVVTQIVFFLSLQSVKELKIIAISPVLMGIFCIQMEVVTQIALFLL